MKNNIRYKGNINKTSVTIFFFNWRTKTPRDVTLLGRASCEVFVMLVVVFHSFLFFILLLLFFIHFFLCDIVLHSLLFNVIPQPSMYYRQVLTPILYFQPSPSESDSRHFHFNLSEIFFHSFYHERNGFEWIFFTHSRFLLYAPSPTFYLRLSRPPWRPAVLP